MVPSIAPGVTSTPASHVGLAPSFARCLHKKRTALWKMGRTAALRNGSQRTSEKPEKAKFAEFIFYALG
jgi:hypothetical protein